MFGRLFHSSKPRATDVASQWPEVNLATPAIDLGRKSVGPLPFGSEFEQAAVLGRPTRVTARPDGYCELVYAAAGVQLDFDRGRLAYAAFFVAPDGTVPDCGVQCCNPRFSDGTRFSAASSGRDVLQAWGEPASRDTDADEGVWTYHTGGLTTEVEFDSHGRLKRIAVFPRAT